MPQIITNNNNSQKVSESIKLLSTEVQEIISQKPSWIVQNGIVLFLAIIATMLATTFFISYPDVVNANAIFTSLNTPKEVISKTNGKLIKLLVAEGKEVQAHETLGYVESSALHEDVIELSHKIENAQNTGDVNGLGNISAYKNLGEVQQPCQVFIQAFNTYKQYLADGFFNKKKNMLLQDVSYLQKLHANILQQKTMQLEDFGLAEKTYSANTTLSNEKVIADFEFRNEKSKYLSKALTIPQINASLINNESAMHEKEKEMALLENDIAQQKNIFIQALNTFKSQIDAWKTTYLLTAPLAGKVSFAEFIQENSQLKTGQKICYINPQNAAFYAQIIIPQNNFGKVKKGEQVLLKLNAYPYREFGIIKGKLDFISEIPSDSGFVAKVSLPKGLVTNYNKQLQFTEGLSAQAEIITADLKLSDRRFNELKAVFIKK